MSCLEMASFCTFYDPYPTTLHTWTIRLHNNHCHTTIVSKYCITIQCLQWSLLIDPLQSVAKSSSLLDARAFHSELLGLVSSSTILRDFEQARARSVKIFWASSSLSLNFITCSSSEVFWGFWAKSREWKNEKNNFFLYSFFSFKLSQRLNTALHIKRRKN